MKRRSSSSRMLIVLAVLVVGYWLQRQPPASLPAQDGRQGVEIPVLEGGSGARAIQRAFEERRSKVWIEAEGVVERQLPDDDEGDRHQRFVVRIDGGLTLKFSHNIDLAPPVPIREGSSIRFRGRYEYSELGGVIHWTHHDPSGRLEGGWIELAGRSYR